MAAEACISTVWRRGLLVSFLRYGKMKFPISISYCCLFWIILNFTLNVAVIGQVDSNREHCLSSVNWPASIILFIFYSLIILCCIDANKLLLIDCRLQIACLEQLHGRPYFSCITTETCPNVPIVRSVLSANGNCNRNWKRNKLTNKTGKASLIMWPYSAYCEDMISETKTKDA